MDTRKISPPVIVGVLAALSICAGLVIIWRAHDADVSAPAGPPATTPATSSIPTGPRPNIVMILTDDQTLESMKVMEHTKAELAANGTTFSHYYVSFPNCCPSRATYYTGQFSHNNGVRDNVPPDGGYTKLDAADTLPVWLSDAGYYTANIGKYLNGWGNNGNIARPPGWTHWFGLIDPTTYQYFDYQVSDDGARKTYGHAPEDYQTDVTGAEVVKTIGTAKASGKPFFISWTPLSPHVQSPEQSQLEHHGVEWPAPVPAPRYAGRFGDEPLPETASYDEANVAGLPDFVTSRPRISPSSERLIVRNYRLELETLLATDEWVGKITQALKDQGVWDNTVVMFTSDNGLFHGEHRIPNGKLYLYEPAVHLPLIIAGPGFPKGAIADQVVGNVDLAPTIAALARVQPGLDQDGRNLQPIAADPGTGQGRGMLLENQRVGIGDSIGIHTDRYTYLEHPDGTKELYDLRVDPDQAHNVVNVDGYREVRANLAGRLATLKTCKAASCEGSDAGGGAVPPGPPEPTEGTAESGGTSGPASQDQVVAAARATLSASFSLTNEEEQCVGNALADRRDVLDAATTDITGDPARWGAVITIGRTCIASDRFEEGLAGLLLDVLGEKLGSERATCASKALARLAPKQFEAGITALLDTEHASDPTGVGVARGMMATCGIDAQTYFR